MRAVEHKRVFYVGPNPINIGGDHSKARKAYIVFEAELDSSNWIFDHCTFEGVNHKNWNFEDWMFIKEVATEIEHLKENINVEVIHKETCSI
jgi:hypothetical protein